MTPIFLILAVVAGLIGSFLYVGLNKPITGNALKLVATGLLVAVTVGSLISGKSSAIPLVALSLALIGDVALGTQAAYPAKFPTIPLFEIGLGIFALAYTALGIALVVDYISVISLITFAIVAVAVGVVCLWQMKFFNVEISKPVSLGIKIYMGILTFMTAVAISSNNLWLGLGAIFLYASDSIIAQSKFNTKFALSSKISEYALIGLYYAGFAIILSQICL